MNSRYEIKIRKGGRSLIMYPVYAVMHGTNDAGEIKWEDQGEMSIGL